MPTDGQYANETWPAVERDHAAVITYLDHYVGLLVGLLAELNIEKETIVFFASDNGALLYAAGVCGRRMRHCLFDMWNRYSLFKMCNHNTAPDEYPDIKYTVGLEPILYCLTPY